MNISHHPRVREGSAKLPRHSFIMKSFLPLLILVVLIGIPVFVWPLWTESSYDTLTLWMTPPSAKALQAADLALALIKEEGNDKQALAHVYAVQDFLTVIEQNLDVSGNTHKALRTQQEIEKRLNRLHDALAQLKKRSMQYDLVVQNAALRVDLLLQETVLAEEKTKAKLDA